MKYQEQAELIEKSQLQYDIFRYKVKTQNIAKQAEPGQFLEIKVDDGNGLFLRRPISIFNVENDELEFIFQVKGEGTKALSKKQVGEKIDILGPLGYGTFSIKEYNTVAIIGGGIGVYPLHEAAKRLKGKTKINTYLGFRNKDYVTVEDEFRKVSDKLIITTDDGSYGEKGFAIDFLKQDEKPDIIMACGPLPMLRAVKQYAIENGIKCEVSLEERMGCGLGACLGCAVKTAQSPKEAPEYWHVCKAGPVFEAKDVEF